MLVYRLECVRACISSQNMTSECYYVTYLRQRMESERWAPALSLLIVCSLARGLLGSCLDGEKQLCHSTCTCTPREEKVFTAFRVLQLRTFWDFNLANAIFFFFFNFRYCPELMQWGAADAEIKVPSGENTELRRSPFKAWSKSVYSHTCYAYCQGFLSCLFLHFRSIHLHFSKTSPDFSLC